MSWAVISVYWSNIVKSWVVIVMSYQIIDMSWAVIIMIGGNATMFPSLSIILCAKDTMIGTEVIMLNAYKFYHVHSSLPWMKMIS